MLSLGLHAIVLGLLFVGLSRQPAPQASIATGTIIQATLVPAPPGEPAMPVADATPIEHPLELPAARMPSQPESGRAEAAQTHQMQSSPPQADPRNIGDVEVIAERDAELLKPRVPEVPRDDVGVNPSNARPHGDDASTAAPDSDAPDPLEALRRQRAEAERQRQRDAQEDLQMRDAIAPFVPGDARTAAAGPWIPSVAEDGSDQAASGDFSFAVENFGADRRGPADSCHRRSAPHRNDAAIDDAFIDCLLDAAIRDWSRRWRH